MNRADGLVQRRRATASANGSGNQEASGEAQGAHSERQSPQDSDGSSVRDFNSNPALDDDSDKETRLTLMEEVLLLGLKDKEVRQLISMLLPPLLTLVVCHSALTRPTFTELFTTLSIKLPFILDCSLHTV